MPLVRVYRSAHGIEFRVLRDPATSALVCTCKEFRTGLYSHPDLGWVSRCRHTRQYVQESATWDPDPLASLDWL